MNTRNRNVLRTGLSILAGLTLTAAANAAPPIPAHNYDVDPAPAPVKTFSAADFNKSGDVSPQDLTDFLAAWFAKSKSADINTSGDVTTTDLWKFMNVYFSSIGQGA